MKYEYIIKGKKVDGWTPVQMLDGTGYTYLNEDGHLMPHRFARVSEFSSQMACVEMKDGNPERRATYVTIYEKVLPLRFEGVENFYGDTATAYIGREEYFVDKNGLCFQFKNTIIDKLRPATKEDLTGIFIKNIKTGKTYTTIFRLIGKTDSMYAIEMKDGSGQTFMDKHFNIMSYRFLAVGKFTNGFASVITFSRRIMYIDKEGKIYTDKQMRGCNPETLKNIKQRYGYDIDEEEFADDEEERGIEYYDDDLFDDENDM